jgi:hypothetical protein
MLGLLNLFDFRKEAGIKIVALIILLVALAIAIAPGKIISIFLE